MVLKRKKIKSPSFTNTVKSTATIAAGFALGHILLMIIVALFALFFCGIGYYLLTTYNKEDTKLFKELQPMQYLGLVLIFIGLLPFLKYFFISFIWSAGSYAFESVAEEF